MRFLCPRHSFSVPFTNLHDDLSGRWKDQLFFQPLLKGIAIPLSTAHTAPVSPSAGGLTVTGNILSLAKSNPIRGTDDNAALT